MTTKKLKSFSQFVREEAPINVTGNIAGLGSDPPVSLPRKSNIRRRRKPKS